jgi:hypothetical protein
MEKVRYVYHQEGDLLVGWLEAYPDYKSQGKTIEELEENLSEIYKEIDPGLRL